MQDSGYTHLAQGGLAAPAPRDRRSADQEDRA